mmetsp:Transcript_9044/g.15817  ORF Transcript_9044/g.15817 Transcript_9044/m.15817 type:complete len:96 (+) Transcript_9044:156-443(+)
MAHKYIDTSGTEWSPLPASFNALPRRMQVFFGASFFIGVATGIHLYLRSKRNIGRTESAEWKAETKRLMSQWPREAAGPVELNPIRRLRYGEPKV